MPGLTSDESRSTLNGAGAQPADPLLARADPGAGLAWVAGITPVSLVAGLFAMLLMGMLIQYADVVLLLTFTSEHTLALPAIWVFVLITVLGALTYLTIRVRLLTRAELLCVLYALLIAAPLMTQGFWHRIVSVIATAPRNADFAQMDAFNDKLWPHGPNILDGFLAKSHEDQMTFAGTHAWEDVASESGRSQQMLVLSNPGHDQTSAVRIRVPVETPDHPGIIREEPYVVSVLIRAANFGETTRYFARLYVDEDPNRLDIFTSSKVGKVTFLHQKGFFRVGAYGMTVPREAKDHVYLEVGLEGTGRMELTEPKLFSVGAMEGIYKGRRIVTQSEFDRLPPGDRAELIVRPDSLWSPAGVRFILAGYIPIRDWALPILAWTTIILLVLLGTLALAIMMRRQWLDNERYLLPIARIPIALIGGDAPPEAPGTPASVARGAVPPMWKNRMTWLGIVLSFGWIAIRACAFYNPNVPNPSINIDLGDYLSSATLGHTFVGTRFEINAIFLALSAFMELNVLLSLVVGYWLFRSQFYVAVRAGWDVNPGFPFRNEQATGAYLAYAAVTAFFLRAYLWRVLKNAWTGHRDPSSREVLSDRGVVLLLFFVGIGFIVWAEVMGISVGGMLLFAGYVLLIGIVSAKIRAECGVTWGYFTPQNLGLFMALMGGIPLFGAQAMLFCFVASFFLAPTVFFLIPGAQLELVELGHRLRIRRSHIVAACVLGVMGGMLIGGWVFLSNAYSLGGQNLRYDWAFTPKAWYFHEYNQELTDATSQMVVSDPAAAPDAAGVKAVGGSGNAGASGVSEGKAHGWRIAASTWAYAYAALGTVLFAVLRQSFAGFWFHPVGFVLGSTNFMDYVWGSALAAWVIRSIVLYLGGAATVRNKLQPFFLGVFIGAVFAELAIGAHASYLHSVGIEKIFPVLAPANG